MRYAINALLCGMDWSLTLKQAMRLIEEVWTSWRKPAPNLAKSLCLSIFLWAHDKETCC